MMKSFLRLLTELTSRKWISRITGSYAKSKFSKPFIPHFAKIYGIRIEDAEKRLDEYQSLNEFFTRRLKPDVRAIDGDASSVISPVDAVITGLGTIESGRIVNVKGQDYTIDELLNDSPRKVNYRDGFYFVLYLSPSDYHRIHAPIGGKIVETEHIAGKVYPVHDFALREMRRVLSRNERLITYIQHAAGELAVVKVGAMNVSSIRYVEPLPGQINKGDELAYFEFGSTVVLLMENGTFRCREDLNIGMPVRMGQSLGKIEKKV
ncbi:archaetidylserine decarboxylase [Ferviditalea candida]|uniref:phosphatidylserine decarboxylase n=1 Tax=Ferviditalea candida TaxID=3108399 RepID=A0ABU5ZE02_9BACL|nr:archaetidylserine decarboxylase [Paenibacillaceae bacterium T2]